MMAPRGTGTVYQSEKSKNNKFLKQNPNIEHNEDNLLLNTSNLNIKITREKQSKF